MKKKHIFILFTLLIVIAIVVFCAYFYNNVQKTNNNNNNNITNGLNENFSNNNLSIGSSKTEEIMEDDDNEEKNMNDNVENNQNSVISDSKTDIMESNKEEYRNVITLESTDLDKTKLINATDNFINTYFLNKDSISRKQQLSAMFDLDYIKKNDSIFSYDIKNDFDSRLITSDKYFISKTDSMVECNYRNGGKTQVGITYQRVYTADNPERTVVNQTITDYYYIQLSNNYKIQDAKFINSSVIDN